MLAIAEPWRSPSISQTRLPAQAGAVVLGYLSHLLLDELYSIQWRRGRIGMKRSFGSALKLYGHSLWANLSAYAKLALLTFLIFRWR